MALTISSPEFAHNQPIPAKFTCQGNEINPTLDIAGVPENAKSLALIMDDPDAPMAKGFVHWVLFNIAPSNIQITEDSVPSGATRGKNSADSNKYIGPCPPTGTHRYFFKLYALDTELSLSPDTTREQLESAIQNHVLEQAELIGIYQKS